MKISISSYCSIRDYFLFFTFNIEILGHFSRFQFIKNLQNSSNVSYLRHFERYKKDRPHFGKLIWLKIFFWCKINVICQLSEVKDDIYVVSVFLCLLGHSVEFCWIRIMINHKFTRLDAVQFAQQGAHIGFAPYWFSAPPPLLVQVHTYIQGYPKRMNL